MFTLKSCSIPLQLFWLFAYLLVGQLLAFTTTSYGHEQKISTQTKAAEEFDGYTLETMVKDQYKIAWKGPLMNEDKINLNEDNIINISTNSNERYLCVVPAHDQLNFDMSAKNSSSSEKSKTPIQIIEPLMKSKLCSYRFDLFWNYELCHGKYLRQYHEENAKFKAKVTQEYYLGRMETELIPDYKKEYEERLIEYERTGQSLPTILVNGHYKPFVQFNMTSGTKCDLTKKPRISKIIYVCNEEPNLELYSIKEISTCEYEAIVLTPSLCQHKDFKIDTNTLLEIQCYSLDGSPKRPKKTIEFEADEEEESSSESKGGFPKRGIAYFQGRTLIIDADLLLS